MKQVSYLALAGGLILLVTTGLYVGLIYAEGDVLAALPWTIAMGLCGLGAVWAAFLPRGPRRRSLFLTVGAVSLLLGLVAIFSIGLLLIAAGVALLAAAAAEPRSETAG